MVDFVFCAINMDKAQTRVLEEAYAKLECPVISNNSAHRATPDVPMIIPEINDAHAAPDRHSAPPLGNQTGIYRGEVQLLAAKLCSGAASSDRGIWCYKGAGLYLSGDFRSW